LLIPSSCRIRTITSERGTALPPRLLSIPSPLACERSTREESRPVTDATKPSAKKPAEQENIKTASNFLRGKIVHSFGNRVTASVPECENFLLKFHGTYMQDNRDIRDERARQRLEPAFDFMVRIRAAGGVVAPQQW